MSVFVPKTLSKDERHAIEKLRESENFRRQLYQEEYLRNS
jgi:hypothetical protein